MGTTYLLPADVYRWRGGPEGGVVPRAPQRTPKGAGVAATGAHGSDAGAAGGAAGGAAARPGEGPEAVSIRHYAHVLTEHCPVAHAAKYLLGLDGAPPRGSS